jgi:flavin reductase (DIM6/NTAB) family NADH-FMN oxidoreductase RutF
VPHAGLVGPIPSGVDPDAYDRRRRQILWALPSGLYLVASRDGGRANLMVASFVSQLATDPKLLGVAVEAGAVTHELIAGSGVFALVLLGRGERAALRRFVKPAAHDAEARTLAGEPYTDAPATGVPIPHLAAAYLDCRVTERLALGSHELFVGEVLDAEVRNEGALAEVLEMADTRMSYGG